MLSSAPIRHQLLVALVAPALIALGGLAWMADTVARGALEKALGERLCAVAQAAALAVSPRISLLERGDDDSRIAKRTRKELATLARTTDVARVFFVHRDSPRLLVDTSSDSQIGDEYTRADFDKLEIEQVKRGAPAASVLFLGPRGEPFKTGYAPLRDRDGEITGYAGVVAPATYAEAIEDLRSAMAGITVLGLVLLLIAATWSARRLAVPLTELSEAAVEIGRGKLDTTFPSRGPREAEVLSRTMRQMASSLEEREREMQMMLAGIAHEVRNPLGGIELFGGLLKEDLEDDPRQKHVLKILRELKTLSKVVNDFLDFARKKAPEPSTVPLADLALEIAAVLESDSRALDVSLTVDIPKDLMVRADAESIRGAILNLVRNALQAAPRATGRVRLSALAAGRDVSIRIEDNGPGVPEGQREEIFAPFFTTKQKGTGLGLALVQKTIRAHQGTIRVEESTLGGATFVVSLPAATS